VTGGERTIQATETGNYENLKPGGWKGCPEIAMFSPGVYQKKIGRGQRGKSKLKTVKKGKNAKDPTGKKRKKE